MNSIVAYPDTPKKAQALKEFLEDLGVRFEESEHHYSQAFIDKIERSRAEIAAGKSTVVKPEDLKQFLGLL